MGRKQRNILILALVVLVVLAAFWIQRQLLSQEGAKAVLQVGGQGG